MRNQAYLSKGGPTHYAEQRLTHTTLCAPRRSAIESWGTRECSSGVRIVLQVLILILGRGVSVHRWDDPRRCSTRRSKTRPLQHNAKTRSHPAYHIKHSSFAHRSFPSSGSAGVSSPVRHPIIPRFQFGVPIVPTRSNPSSRSRSIPPRPTWFPWVASRSLKGIPQPRNCLCRRESRPVLGQGLCCLVAGRT